MRLKPDEIKKLAQHSIDNLLKEKSVKAKVARGALIDAVVAVLGHHFEEERKLDSDAENLYRQNSGQFEGLDKGKARGEFGSNWLQNEILFCLVETRGAFLKTS